MNGGSVLTRAEQREKRREEILNAGLDLFVRKGYASTKVQDIAQAVGMSVGLMFNYFESKEKLYEELIRIGVSGPQSVVPTSTEDPLTYFEATAEMILYSAKHEPFTAKMFVLMNQAFFSDVVSPAVREMLAGTDIITSSVPLIIVGQENETIKEGDPFALALAYWSAIMGIAASLAMVPEAPCPEAEWVVDILRRKPE